MLHELDYTPYCLFKALSFAMVIEERPAKDRPMRVLIAPDKFKGTLSATDAAQAMADGWSRARSQDDLTLLPISDGGDGFGRLLGQHLQAEARPLETVDAAHRPLRATWWWIEASRTAIIESAGIIGLALLPSQKFHPFQLDTVGLGAAIRAACEFRASRCLFGIGGSATNDGGYGLAKALGFQFLDHEGKQIVSWTGLVSLNSIVHPDCLWSIPSIEVAVDVQNPLLGLQGSSRIFGPQKGLKTDDLPLAEACLQRLASVCAQTSRQNFDLEPGAGAAGGLGFGLRAFLQARLRPGFALFAELVHLNDCLDQADLVLTGEGAIDASSLMGKGVGELVCCCQQKGIPCIGLGGVIQGGISLAACFQKLYSLTPEFTTCNEAMSRPAFWLAQATEKAASSYPFS